MANNGAVSKTLNAGQSYTIPAGYHNGSRKVTANSLASQTQATATANNLPSGVTAWVNGNKITGNGTDVNNSYNNGYNAGKASVQLTNGGVVYFGDDISDPDSSSNKGISEKTVSVTQGRYVIVCVNLRFKNYQSASVTMSCTSGMNVIAYSTNEIYNKWYGTFGQAYVFFGYTTANSITLKSSQSYRWSGSINYINIQ